MQSRSDRAIAYVPVGAEAYSALTEPQKLNLCIQVLEELLVALEEESRTPKVNEGACLFKAVGSAISGDYNDALRLTERSVAAARSPYVTPADVRAKAETNYQSVAGLRERLDLLRQLSSDPPPRLVTTGEGEDEPPRALTAQQLDLRRRTLEAIRLRQAARGETDGI